MKNIKTDEQKEVPCTVNEGEGTAIDKTVEKTPPKTPSESKAVKFEGVVNYAEETPLMFSRSSSLASLDSIYQHSIHDDRSSVISDFRFVDIIFIIHLIDLISAQKRESRTTYDMGNLSSIKRPIFNQLLKTGYHCERQFLL